LTTERFFESVGALMTLPRARTSTAAAGRSRAPSSCCAPGGEKARARRPLRGARAYRILGDTARPPLVPLALEELSTGDAVKALALAKR
jgi:hypothetical protein